MYCTDTETLQARKPHRCMSCGEGIAVSDEYKRWRCYDDGDAGTVKMHPECYAAHCADSLALGGVMWDVQPYSHSRGVGFNHEH